MITSQEIHNISNTIKQFEREVIRLGEPVSKEYLLIRLKCLKVKITTYEWTDSIEIDYRNMCFTISKSTDTENPDKWLLDNYVRYYPIFLDDNAEPVIEFELTE